MRYLLFLFLFSFSSLIAQEKEYPVAIKRPHSIILHKDTVRQPYFWMKEKNTPEIVNYLEEENFYTERKMKPHAILQKKIFEEMRSMIKEDTKTRYTKNDNYYYYQRSVSDKEYPILCRKKGDTTANEQVYFDINKVASEIGYFNLVSPSIFKNNQLFVYIAVTDGGDFGRMYIKDLEKDTFLLDQISNVSSFRLMEDNQHIIYKKRDANNLLGNQLYVHKIGSDTLTDIKLFSSTKKSESLSFYISESKKYLILTLSTFNRTEQVLVLDLEKGFGSPFVEVFKGRDIIRYYINHIEGESFVVYTNENAPNFQIKNVNLLTDKKEKIILPEDKYGELNNLMYKNDYLLYSHSTKGVNRLSFMNTKTKAVKSIPIIDSAGVMNFADLMEKDSTHFEFTFSSMKTIAATYRYDLVRDSFYIVERDSFDFFKETDYVTERVWTLSRDGEKVPVDLIYPKGFKKDGSHPMYLTGYGCYGNNLDPTFQFLSTFYLKRGFAFGIVHVRGESFLGQNWHRSGMLDWKKNTFNDFEDATRYLIKEKYTSPKRVVAQGGSAGGMLMGAIANQAPELYGAIIADVPFVNTLEDMQDTLWPNIKMHFEEIGNPFKKMEYEYIKSYSPLHNIKKQAYPPMLVTAGYNDSRVPYWSPAQYVARLREMKIDTNLLLLKTEMGSGHFGGSGRYTAMKEYAFKIAFMLQALGIQENYLQIKGQIIDENNRPITYANIQVQGTDETTTTDYNGEFNFEIRATTNLPVLLIEAVGFKNKRFVFDQKTRIKGLKITLVSNSKLLKTIVIDKSKNFANEVIKKANKRKDYYDRLIDNYSVNIYHKSVGQLDSVPKNIELLGIKVIKIENDSLKGIVFMSESVAKYEFKKPDLFKEEVLSSRVVGDKSKIDQNRNYSHQYNFYQDLIEIFGLEKRFVSPIADGSMFIYKYKYLTEFYDGNDLVYVIKVEPRNLSEAAFSGNIFIRDKTFDIHSLDLYLTKRTGISMDTVRFIIQNKLINDSISLPKTAHIEAKDKFLNIKMTRRMDAKYYNYEVNKVFPKKYFDKQVYRVQEGVNKKDSVYWKENRKIILSDKEMDFENRRKKMLDTMKIGGNKDTVRSKSSTISNFFQNLFLSGYSYQYKNKSTFSIESALSKIRYNTVEGFSKTILAKYYKPIFDSIDSTLIKSHTFQNPHRYGFASKKYFGALDYQFDNYSNQQTFNVTLGDFIFQYNANDPIDPFVNGLYSLVDKRNYMKLYGKQFVKFIFSDQLLSGPFVKLSAEFAHRYALQNHDSLTWIKKTSHFTSNNPLNPFNDQLSFVDNNILKLSFSGSYKIGERYEIIFKQRNSLGSKYPRINWLIEQGIGNTFNYTQFELSLDQTIRLGYWGKFSFDFHGGTFLNKKEMNFIDYKHFNGNQTLFLKNGINAASNANFNYFNALNYYDFSTNDSYLELHVQHRFLGVLLNKIPLIKRLNFSELVGINAVYTSNNRKYQEIYFGIENIKALRIDFVAPYQVGIPFKPVIRIGITKAF